ncbi:DUF4174 domain-containing protein [Frigidibacter sp. ROC022]|uniref:DUF4174 domain-containing protein n=1 Tax=Frigidibacter sp. ROC022 TaxID=2971796 RepID=UPI00215A0FDE|nr:DUF4174 domain-containing protein [Frigidibacter sp. ROC022]MCR8723134.1 DUF4174 domain-containing protein [Frigidibacter sp. ROC022]
MRFTSIILGLALALFPMAAAAQALAATDAPPAEGAPQAEAETVDHFPIAITDERVEDFLWRKRLVVVFADTPLDPSYIRQIELLTARPEDLVERDVVVLTDTDPAARSAIRTELRPRGFAMVIVDKDGRVLLRKPSPWDVREITRAIDKTPLRQEELRDARDADARARNLSQ